MSHYREPHRYKADLSERTGVPVAECRRILSQLSIGPIHRSPAGNPIPMRGLEDGSEKSIPQAHLEGLVTAYHSVASDLAADDYSRALRTAKSHSKGREERNLPLDFLAQTAETVFTKSMRRNARDLALARKALKSGFYPADRLARSAEKVVYTHMETDDYAGMVTAAGSLGYSRHNIKAIKAEAAVRLRDALESQSGEISNDDIRRVKQIVEQLGNDAYSKSLRHMVVAYAHSLQQHRSTRARHRQAGQANERAMRDRGHS
jgi:hypothetical protein